MTIHTTDIGRIARRLAITAVALLIAATGTVAAHGGGMMGSGGLFGGTMGLWGLLWMGLLVAVPLYVLYVLLGRDSDGTDGQSLSVLRERYARGELSDEEFDRRRERLERTG